MGNIQQKHTIMHHIVDSSQSPDILTNSTNMFLLSDERNIHIKKQGRQTSCCIWVLYNNSFIYS